MRKDRQRRMLATIINGWLLAALFTVPIVAGIIDHWNV